MVLIIIHAFSKFFDKPNFFLFFEIVKKMPCLFPVDCLYEVFENLEYDKSTLYSCLLVNRLWCKVSVRILWRDIWGFGYQPKVLSTLISCLPNESKELLHKNEIFIATPTLNPSKPSLFNYASFFKVIDIDIQEMNLNYSDCLVAKEILKMFMNQISSLKKLTITITCNITFTSFPGARDCLKDLSELELRWTSHFHSELFYGLSQICHNLQSLTIYIGSEVSNGLKELVSSQNNLKFLDLSVNHIDDSWTDIIPALMKHRNTLTKLHLCYGYFINLSAPLLYVSSFLNLQEINFSFYQSQYEDFKKLQYVAFPKLQILKIMSGASEHLTKFLETNGKYLQELYLNSNALKSSIVSLVKLCPNLKKFYAKSGNKLDTLKTLFNSCQHLEGLVIWYGKSFNEKELLETVAKHSPKNFHELKLRGLDLLPESLESFFVNWQNRGSKKSISLIVVKDCNILNVNEESMKIIEKYKNLGVIKKFVTRIYCDPYCL